MFFMPVSVVKDFQYHISKKFCFSQVDQVNFNSMYRWPWCKFYKYCLYTKLCSVLEMLELYSKPKADYVLGYLCLTKLLQPNRHTGQKHKDPVRGLIHYKLITLLYAVTMQEQNRQVSRLEGRQNDEGKWDEIRLKVKEIEDVISRRERFGAGFFNWSNRCCAAADGESLASLNEPLTAQRSHIPLDLHTPEVATTGTSMPVAKLEVCRAFCY
jgi:hypothetical protein